MAKKKSSLKEVFDEYMKDGLKLERWRLVGLLMLVAVFAGFFGWVYEFIFYYFDGAKKRLYFTTNPKNYAFVVKNNA